MKNCLRRLCIRMEGWLKQDFNDMMRVQYYFLIVNTIFTFACKVRNMCMFKTIMYENYSMLRQNFGMKCMVL